jgi:O-antigen ligase
MHGLPLRFKSLFSTERPLSYHLQLARARSKALAIPALAIGTLALAAASGLLATVLPLLPERRVKMLAGLPVLFVAFSSPHLVVLFMLIMSSTVFDSSRLPNVFRLTVVELCLLLLLGLIVARVLSDRREDTFVRTPLDWPVFLFFLIGTISFFNAKYNLGAYNYAFSIPVWRVLFDYMVFFAVTNFVRTRRQLLTLVGGMFVSATVVAALIIAQQVAGPAASVIPGIKAAWAATTLGQEFGGVARVSTSGSAIVYVMLLPAFILHITPEYLKTRKWLSFITIVLLLMAIAFTFDRNMWIGATLAGIVFVLVARLESKNFVLLLLVLAVAASLLVPLAGAYFPRIDNIAEALSFRAASLFAGDELMYDSSTQWRLKENELAIPRIKEYPVLGTGPGSEWREPMRQGGDPLTHYIHNAYLYLLLDVGIMGFLPFLWFSIVYLVRGFSSWYMIQDPVLKGLAFGFSLSYIAVLSSSMTSPRLLEPNYAPLIGVMLGITEVAIRLRRQSSQ